MTFNRRVFLALLGLAPAAPAFGQGDLLRTVSDGINPDWGGTFQLDPRVPVDLRNIACRVIFIEKLQINHLLSAIGDCTYGNEWPKYIVFSPDQWDEFWKVLSPRDRQWRGTGELADRGFYTIPFCSAQAVKDTTLRERTIYIVNPKRKDDPNFNRKIEINAFAARAGDERLNGLSEWIYEGGFGGGGIGISRSEPIWTPKP